MNLPILEFDPTREAIIEPHMIQKALDAPENCVICFFQDVLDDVIAEHSPKVIKKIRSESGYHPVYEIEYKGKRLAFFHPGIGASFSSTLLEEVIAIGCRKFIACGGAGVLNRELAVGHLLIVNSAVRDEGTSYHYLPPSREVQADPQIVSIIASEMDRQGIPYIHGKAWTTDAPYRETRQRMITRRDEGCLMVDMECSALIAVSQFRNAMYGQILYGGDDLSGPEWDHRDWTSRNDVRHQLFWLSADICVQI